MDIITRLLLKTNDFDANLNKAKGSVNNFQGGISNMAKTAGASVMKFAGTIGIAVGAYEGFNKAMNSSQTLSDEYNRTIDGLKGGVDQFFYSIGSGDWTPFFNGLDETIRKAREAYTAMDQLGNTKISFGYFNMKNQAEYQKQITIIKDKDSTPEQKADAKNILDATLKDQNEIVGQLKRRSNETMRALVAESTGINSADVSMMSVERTLRLDVSSMGDTEKKRLSEDYKRFQEIAKNERAKATTYEMVETGGGISKGWAKVDHIDMDAYNKAMAPVLSKYQDAVVYNGVLVKKSDEWLQNLTRVASESFAAEQAYESMVKSANRATQSGGGRTGAEKEIIPVGSIGSIDAELSALNKKLVRATTMEARVAVQTTINELEQRKVNIKVVVEQEVFRSKYNKTNGGDLSAPILGTSGYKESSKLTLSDGGKKKFKSPIKKGDINLNQKYADSLLDIGTAFGSMGQMASQFGEDGLSFALNSIGSITQMIVQLQGLATAQGVASAMALPFPANIGAIATVIGTITSIFSSLPAFETGGVIPGTSFSGDKVLARVNSGEMILNDGQQSRLFRLLNGGAPSADRVNAVPQLANLSRLIAPSQENRKIELAGSVRVKGQDLELSFKNRNRITGKIK